MSSGDCTHHVCILAQIVVPKVIKSGRQALDVRSAQHSPPRLHSPPRDSLLRTRRHYTGTLYSNCKQFDSSVGRGPFSFTLGAGEVIQGWDTGLKGMCVGEKRKLTIPANLGYGSTGAGDDIPGGATLQFQARCERRIRFVSSDGDRCVRTINTTFVSPCLVVRCTGGIARDRLSVEVEEHACASLGRSSLVSRWRSVLAVRSCSCQVGPNPSPGVHASR